VLVPDPDHPGPHLSPAPGSGSGGESSSSTSTSTAAVPPASGGISMVCIGSNASSTRRLLVSRSGHVFIARGLSVTALLADSLSDFLRRQAR
jgi:hypothetical protein